jgi:hypothetical protein
MRPAARSLRAAPFPNCSRFSAVIFSAMIVSLHGPSRPLFCAGGIARAAQETGAHVDHGCIPHPSPKSDGRV